MAVTKKPGVWDEVLIAGAITLAVTLLRLVGELQQWDPRYFSREPGGQGALVGIGWLMLLVPFWLGRRVAANSGRPRMGRGFLIALVAIGLFVGGSAAVTKFWPKDFATLVKWFTYGTWPLAALTLFAWPRVFFANVAYAVLARAPVIAVQYVALAKNWDTHYSKLAPELGDQPRDQWGEILLFPQVFFWMPATVMIGSLFALLGALTVRQRN